VAVLRWTQGPYGSTAVDLGRLFSRGVRTIVSLGRYGYAHADRHRYVYGVGVVVVASIIGANVYGFAIVYGWGVVVAWKLLGGGVMRCRPDGPVTLGAPSDLVELS